MEHTVSLKTQITCSAACTKGKERGESRAWPSNCRKNKPGLQPPGSDGGGQAGQGPWCATAPAAESKRPTASSEGAFFPGYDIVVVARVRAAHSRYRELERSLLSLADKLGLLRKEGA